jgi:Na+/H+ antiporter NhaC
METWRFLVSLGVLLVVWVIIVTLLGQPPTPLSLMIATVFAAISLFLSDLFIRRYLRDTTE